MKVSVLCRGTQYSIEDLETVKGLIEEGYVFWTNTSFYIKEEGVIPRKHTDVIEAVTSKSCCICGAVEGMTKHHVVPRRYCRWMPGIQKKCRAFDIVWVCEACHRYYEKVADGAETKLLRMYTTEYTPLKLCKPSPEVRGWLHLTSANIISERIPSVLAHLGNITIGELHQKVKELCRESDVRTHGIRTITRDVLGPKRVRSFWKNHFYETMSPAIPHKWTMF